MKKKNYEKKSETTKKNCDKPNKLISWQNSQKLNENKTQKF